MTLGVNIIVCGGLDKKIEDLALIVDGSPKDVMPSLNDDDDFIEMPQ
jgi:hypothetical protein